MKRSFLRRKKPLRSRGKHGTRFPKAINRAYRRHIRTLDCDIADKHRCRFYPERPGVEPAHVDPWGSSGTDEGNLVPLCPLAHDEQEGENDAFEGQYEIDLHERAAFHWRNYTDEDFAA